MKLTKLTLCLAACLMVSVPSRAESNDNVVPKATQRKLEQAFKKGKKDFNWMSGHKTAVVSDAIPDTQLISFAHANGYRIVGYGRHKSRVNCCVYYILNEEIPEWIIEQSFPDFHDKALDIRRKSKKWARFTKIGSMTLFDGTQLDSISWTGEIRHGKIHGTGVGAKMVDVENAFVVSGTFNEGKLAGEGYYRQTEIPDDGAIRLAGGYYRDLNAKKRTLATNYVLQEAGQYGKVTKSGDGISRMERANYLWDKNKRKSYLQYKAGDKYVEGAYWYYVDENLKPIAKFPIETRTEEIQPFKHGKAVVRNCNVHPRDHQTVEDLDWVEYYVYRDGRITFSDSEKERILQLFDTAMTDWGTMMDEFNAAFSNPAKTNLLYGPSGYGQNWERHLSNCVLDGAMDFLRTKRANADCYIPYTYLLKLYEIYHSKTVFPGEWNMTSKMDDAMASYNDHSYSYRKGNEERFIKYLKADWMTDRLNKAVSLADRLMKDSGFNVPEKSKKLDAILKGIRQLEQDYASMALEARWNLLAKMSGSDQSSELKGEMFDKERSVSPSVLKRKQDILLGWYYQYENDGTIRFIGTDDFVNYNATYDEIGSDIKLSYYTIKYNTLSSSLDRTYSTKEAMLNAIVAAWSERYH